MGKPEPTGIVKFKDMGRGHVSGDAGVSWQDVQDLVVELDEALGEMGEAKLYTWAGPYEIVMAASAVVGAASAATGSIVAVLNHLAGRRRDLTVQVELDEDTTVTLTGDRVPEELARRIASRFPSTDAVNPYNPGYPYHLLPGAPDYSGQDPDDYGEDEHDPDQQPHRD